LQTKLILPPRISFVDIKYCVGGRMELSMTDGLSNLLANNAEINQYYSSLPQNVQNAVVCSGEDICSLEDLLTCIKGITGSCQG